MASKVGVPPLKGQISKKLSMLMVKENAVYDDLTSPVQHLLQQTASFRL